MKTAPSSVRATLAAILVAGLVGACAPDDAPDIETSSPLIGGTLVGLATERSLGLVSVGSPECSGSLFGRDWVLTATHCINAFNFPTAVTVKIPKPDGTREVRSANALLQVGTTDLTLVHMPVSTSTTWPTVAHAMYPGDPSQLSMSCMGMGPTAYKQPSGLTGGGTYNSVNMSGPLVNGEVVFSSPTGSPAAAPGDSGSPCFIGNRIAAVGSWAAWECADTSTDANCVATITKITESHFRWTGEFSRYIDRAPARTALATFQQLGHYANDGIEYTLDNGWSNHPYGTNNAGATLIQGTVHLRGAIATGGTNPVPLTLPKGMRPSAGAYIPITLCNAAKGRLYIDTQGVVTVEAENADFAKAQCFTSLDGVSFEVNTVGTTPLTLINSWRSYGTRPAAARVVDGVVHFQGSIAGGTTAAPFTLTSAFRPVGRTIYVPVDLCNAHKGRLVIDVNGTVTINTFGAFAEAQCFTSLEGVSYPLDAAGGATLALNGGWSVADAVLHTGSPSVKNVDGIVRFSGALKANVGTTAAANGVAFTLPDSMWPATLVYIPIDLCAAQKGRIYITTTGNVGVDVPPGATWSTAQCFVSLEGASYGF
jgi:hypothetical protein